jgi:hypothetical protein
MDNTVRRMPGEREECVELPQRGDGLLSLVISDSLLYRFSAPPAKGAKAGVY